jgi:hypothetical protein
LPRVNIETPAVVVRFDGKTARHRSANRLQTGSSDTCLNPCTAW